MNKNQKGVSLIITFFIMVIILAVAMSVSALLYSQVKVIKNIGNSIISLSVADSGIEKVLYYDKQVIPVLENGSKAKRGFCSMLSYGVDNPDACPDESDRDDLDKSLYCNFSEMIPLDQEGKGCDLDLCDNCQVTFETDFNNRKYSITAYVVPAEEDLVSSFIIESKGEFDYASRKLKIVMNAPQSASAIVVRDACANPKSTPQGSEIDISAYVAVTIQGDSIDSVLATINDAKGNVVVDNIELELTSGSLQEGLYKYTWSTTESNVAQEYYVDLLIKDTIDPPNIKKILKINPYPMCIGDQY